MKNSIYEDLVNNNTSLGIELGSTRIKGVLIDSKANTIAEGSFDWENKLIDGLWTYDLEDVWTGIQETYKQIQESIENEYNYELIRIGSIGFSAMMHGYLAFDKNDKLLVPFRTWRNAMTQEAETELTALFNFNIPQRWSIAHLYQAILNGEEHVKDIEYFTTLAGYVHWKLTGEKVLGIGDASGMFPIDSESGTYNTEMIKQFNTLVDKKGIDLDLEKLLPKSMKSGKNAGFLTSEGAKLLDPLGKLQTGIPFVPPEGDAGTGMVATNSIAPNTGNISAGTSVFSMIVLDKDLSRVYPEIDIVTTPDGDSVAMVHVNNCTTEINSWVGLFADLLDKMNVDYEIDGLYEVLFNSISLADNSSEGILSYGYHSGENITKINEGRPLLVRMPNAKLNISNLMKSQIESAFATLNIGMQILFDEGVKVKSMVGHGGIFKTEGVAQKIVANAIESPLTLMTTASEGGAWGMALLAQYYMHSSDKTLEEYLNESVFKVVEKIEYSPKENDIVDYRKFIKRYEAGLEIEKTAIKTFKGV